MKILYVTAPAAPLVPAAVDALGHDTYEVVDVGPDDDGYWKLLNGLWQAREDFAIVEHDVVVGKYTMAGFAECPSPWCVSTYAFERGVIFGLGCTRFRAELMDGACLGLMDRVGERAIGVHPRKHWCTLDAFIQLELVRAGYTPHRHAPVTHLSSVRAHEACRGELFEGRL